MFKDGRDYNGSRGCKLCGLYSLEWIQMTNLKNLVMLQLCQGMSECVSDGM